MFDLPNTGVGKSVLEASCNIIRTASSRAEAVCRILRSGFLEPYFVKVARCQYAMLPPV